MPTNPPTGMPRILARVCYADIASAIEFLSGAFGFEEREEARVPNEDGSIALTEMQVVDSAQAFIVRYDDRIEVFRIWVVSVDPDRLRRRKK